MWTVNTNDEVPHIALSMALHKSRAASMLHQHMRLTNLPFACLKRWRARDPNSPPGQPDASVPWLLLTGLWISIYNLSYRGGAEAGKENQRGRVVGERTSPPTDHRTQPPSAQVVALPVTLDPNVRPWQSLATIAPSLRRAEHGKKLDDTHRDPKTVLYPSAMLWTKAERVWRENPFAATTWTRMQMDLRGHKSPISVSPRSLAPQFSPESGGPTAATDKAMTPFALPWLHRQPGEKIESETTPDVAAETHRAQGQRSSRHQRPAIAEPTLSTLKASRELSIVADTVERMVERAVKVQVARQRDQMQARVAHQPDAENHSAHLDVTSDEAARVLMQNLDRLAQEDRFRSGRLR